MVEQLCQKDETGSKYVAAISEYKFSHFRQYQPVPLISTISFDALGDQIGRRVFEKKQLDQLSMTYDLEK